MRSQGTYSTINRDRSQDLLIGVYYFWHLNFKMGLPDNTAGAWVGVKVIYCVIGIVPVPLLASNQSVEF
jgi:hypothetical protein